VRQVEAQNINGIRSQSLPIAYQSSESIVRASVQTSASTAALALHSPQLGAVVAISKSESRLANGGS